MTPEIWTAPVNNKQVTLTLDQSNDSFVLDIHGARGRFSFMYLPDNVVDQDTGRHFLYDLRSKALCNPDTIFYVGILGFVDKPVEQCETLALRNHEFREFRKEYDRLSEICRASVKGDPLPKKECQMVFDGIETKAKQTGDKVAKEEKAIRVQAWKNRKVRDAAAWARLK